MQQALAQDTETQATIDVINRFGEAFNNRDVDGIMALMSDDCVFEGVGAPDGARFEGQAEVREAWDGLFAAFLDSYFDEEELFAAGDRCVTRWIMTWKDAEGNPGRMRGTDIYTVRDGKVWRKLAYLKG